MHTLKWVPMLNFLMSAVCYAGGGHVGGGGSIVCRDVNQKILSAQFYDLFEASSEGRQIKQATASANRQIETAVGRLDSPFAKSYLKVLTKDILSRIYFLPDGLVFQAPPDMGSERGVVVPAGCRLEGIGYYNEDGRLGVSADIFNKLTPTDQAAFILHEVIYKRARQLGATTSADSRRFNAILFAADSRPSDYEDIVSGLELVNNDAVVISGVSSLSDVVIHIMADDMINPGRISRLRALCSQDYDSAVQLPEPSKSGVVFQGNLYYGIHNENCLRLGVGAGIDSLLGPYQASIQVDVYLGGILLATRTSTDLLAEFNFTFALPDASVPSIPTSN